MDRRGPQAGPRRALGAPAVAYQYDCRRDRLGWTVFDRWTDEPVILSQAAQTALSWREADDLVERLNRRRLPGDRSLLP